MDCNKDEATRAMSIAESKLKQKDFSGAKKFALKAQSLYPGLCGISHMLTTLDVYLAAENKLSGEIVDWYGVLGVDPSADEGTIKKQYRKLALLLHPDKNNFVGADGAFKLVSEAWSLLADKEKRMAYNQRRGKAFHQKIQTHPGGPSAQHNGPAYTTCQAVPLRSRQQKVPRPSQQSRSAKVPSNPNPSPFHLRSDAFWTVCRGCNIYFEYLKKYCNCTLLCRICEKPFLAAATALPISSSSSARPVPWDGQKNSFKKLANQNCHDPKSNVSAVKRSHTESHASAGLEGCFKKVQLEVDGKRYGVKSCENGDFGTGIYGCS